MTSNAYRLRPVLKVDPAGPVDRTRLATVALHVSEMLYVIAGAMLILGPFSWDRVAGSDFVMRAGTCWVLAALCIGLAVLSLQVGRGLRRRKRWAFRAAVVLFAVYVPTFFMPIGAVGLYGLLSEGTRARFRAYQARRDGR